MDSARMAHTSKSNGAASIRKKTVFVVDDQPLLRQGLAMLINREPDLVVCGEAEEASTAMKAIASVRPDILIADISLMARMGWTFSRTFACFTRTFRC
jgi:DNA-binding NarL/FixJ family response regulator